LKTSEALRLSQVFFDEKHLPEGECAPATKARVRGIETGAKFGIHVDPAHQVLDGSPRTVDVFRKIFQRQAAFGISLDHV